MKKEFENQGKIICNKNILFSIVSLATKEINGVIGLSKRGTNIVARTFQNEDFNGIKIKYNANGMLIVDVYIDVYNNISAPDLCFKVQENIKNNILSMADIRTAKINVHIVDVVVKKDEEEDEDWFKSIRFQICFCRPI